jgi:thiamine-phosphate diphosphorylase
MPGAAPRLLLITPPQPQVARLVELLPLLYGIADAVLLRWPGLPDRACLASLVWLRRVHPRPLLLVSDRFDLALAAGLDGVQLRDDGLPPALVRAVAPHLLVGVSRHAQSVGRGAHGADYVVLAPVFATAGKPSVEPLGIARLAELARSATLPVLALGGIAPQRVAACLRAGAHGIAARSWVWEDRDPLARAAELRAALAAS